MPSEAACPACKEQLQSKQPTFAATVARLPRELRRLVLDKGTGNSLQGSFESFQLPNQCFIARWQRPIRQKCFDCDHLSNREEVGAI